LAKIAPFLAEFVGTFLLTFLALACNSIGDKLWNSTVCGLFVYAVIFAFSKVSGGLVNPAVTFAGALSGKIGWAKAFGFTILQVLAAMCAGSVNWLLFGPQQLVYLPNGYSMVGACVIEMFYSTVLCFVFLNVAILDERNDELSRHLYAFAVGSVIVAAGCAAGPVSGGVVNPAVSLSFPLFALHLDSVSLRLFYALFQMIGALLATAFYFVCARGRGQNQSPGLTYRASDAAAVPYYPAVEVESQRTDQAWAGSGIFVLRVHDVSTPEIRSKPTIVTRHGKHQYLSTHLEDSPYSSWGGLNDFVIPVGDGSSISIDVVDGFNSRQERVIGTVVVDLRRLIPGKVFRTRERLVPGQGSIEFEIRFDGTVNAVPLPRVVKSSASLAWAPNSSPSLFGNQRGSGSGSNLSDMYSGQLYGKLLAEFIGTFVITFTIVLAQILEIKALSVAAAAVYMAMYLCFKDISGSYFNPGVTVAMQAASRGKLSHTLLYILVQLLAAVLGGVLSVCYVGQTPGLGATLLQLGSYAPNWLFVIPLEMLFTAILSYTYLVVTTPGFPFTLSIGVVELVGTISSMKISAGLMNQALTLSLAIARVRVGLDFPWWQLLFFFFTQFSGAFVAAMLFILTRKAAKAY